MSEPQTMPGVLKFFCDADARAPTVLLQRCWRQLSLRERMCLDCVCASARDVSSVGARWSPDSVVSVLLVIISL